MVLSRKPSGLRIRCMTYNLNRGNAHRDWLDLLLDEDASDPADLPDLYVFSFQLSRPSSAFSLLTLSSLHGLTLHASSQRELAPLYLTFSSFTSSAIRHRHNDIIRALSNITETIKGRAQPHSTIDLNALTYHLVSKEVYGGLALMVYARSDTTCLSIHRVDVARASCGVFNLMNNKGAVGIRLALRQAENQSEAKSPESRGEELITFVNAHLTAHDSGLLARNQDYQSILNKLLFASTTQPRNPATIYDCTHVFFMGDLNYRITISPQDAPSNAPSSPKITHQQLRQMLQDGPFFPIVSQHDTLTHQHRARNVLDGLREGPITFRPSYKYERVPPNRLVDFDHRLPGWTDRIFFASWNDEESSDRDSRSRVDGTHRTQVLQYDCLPHLFGSDHKPVWALFDIPSWHSDPSQRLLKFKPFRQRVVPDRWWREKLWIGSVFDRLSGIGLLAVLVLGFGSFRLGMVNILMTVGWQARKLLR